MSFVDNPDFYDSHEEYREAMNKQINALKQQEFKSEQERKKQFTSEDFHNLYFNTCCSQMSDNFALQEYKLARVSAETRWKKWHKEVGPTVSHEEYLKKYNEHQEYVSKLIQITNEKQLFAGEQYLEKQYQASRPFLVPFTKDELRSFMGNFKKQDAKKLSSGDEIEECVVWQGCLHYDLPRFERRRRPEFGKKRVAGQSIELLYNFLEGHLENKEKLQNTCGNLQCMNVKHYTKVQRKKRRKKDVE